jgi:hypothetical protein
MVESNNTQYLHPLKPIPPNLKSEYSLWPQFAAGRVWPSSTLDSLICQAYYNSALINVLKSLLIGDRTKKSGTSSKRDDQDFSHVATSNMYHIQVPQYYIGKRY